jgi:hypothetical protein
VTLEVSVFKVAFRMQLNFLVSGLDQVHDDVARAIGAQAIAITEPFVAILVQALYDCGCGVNPAVRAVMLRQGCEVKRR